MIDWVGGKDMRTRITEFLGIKYPIFAFPFEIFAFQGRSQSPLFTSGSKLPSARTSLKFQQKPATRHAHVPFPVPAPSSGPTAQDSPLDRSCIGHPNFSHPRLHTPASCQPSSHARCTNLTKTPVGSLFQ